MVPVPAPLLTKKQAELLKQLEKEGFPAEVVLTFFKTGECSVAVWVKAGGKTYLCASDKVRDMRVEWLEHAFNVEPVRKYLARIFYRASKGKS